MKAKRLINGLMSLEIPMPLDTRQHLEQIALQFALLKADRALKACAGFVSVPTVYRVLHAQDHKVSTLIQMADAFGCDVVITIVKRDAA